MGNHDFIRFVYGSLNSKNIDTSKMNPKEAIEKFKELYKKNIIILNENSWIKDILDKDDNKEEKFLDYATQQGNEIYPADLLKELEINLYKEDLQTNRVQVGIDKNTNKKIYKYYDKETNRELTPGYTINLIDVDFDVICKDIIKKSHRYKTNEFDYVKVDNLKDLSDFIEEKTGVHVECKDFYIKVNKLKTILLDKNTNNSNNSTKNYHNLKKYIKTIIENFVKNIISIYQRTKEKGKHINDFRLSIISDLKKELNNMTKSEVLAAITINSKNETLDGIDFICNIVRTIYKNENNYKIESDLNKRKNEFTRLYRK